LCPARSGGFLYFEGRADDLIISAGYRIGRSSSSRRSSPTRRGRSGGHRGARPERGHVVRAVVALREGPVGSDVLARELQEHARPETAPYKYPRIID
jgi:acyl-coenzyme A synthetase/AMP-(fatty) acid ligase